MIIKVFLPKSLYFRKKDTNIYGEVTIEEHSITYFVVSEHSGNDLRHLGKIGNYCLSDVSMHFQYDDNSPHIYLTKLNIKPLENACVNIFLYDQLKILQINITDKKTAQDFKEIYYLRELIKFNLKPPANRNEFYSFFCMVLYICDFIQKIFSIIECRPLVSILKYTSLYDHYLEWKDYKNSNSKRRSSFISLDKITGLIVMTLMLFYIRYPGQYLITSSEIVIDQLRTLLHSLKGSPIGLKLNVHLNNFFLDCFSYHIDLWATFIEIVSPVIQYLFIPIAMLGSFGFSFQLAMLADLISLVGLHAHCFYIYAAVLYKIDKISLQVLWKVVLGKRYNPLKNRVESHDYMDRQLYLATIFFTCLLFLMPTILVYYVVFTMLRMCIYLLNTILKLLRRIMLTFPLIQLLKCVRGRLFEMESIEIKYLHSFQNELNSTVFQMQIKSSALTRLIACQKDNIKTSDFLSFKDILCSLIQGKILSIK